MHTLVEIEVHRGRSNVDMPTSIVADSLESRREKLSWESLRNFAAGAVSRKTQDFEPAGRCQDLHTTCNKSARSDKRSYF